MSKLTDQGLLLSKEHAAALQITTFYQPRILVGVDRRSHDMWLTAVPNHVHKVQNEVTDNVVIMPNTSEYPYLIDMPELKLQMALTDDVEYITARNQEAIISAGSFEAPKLILTQKPVERPVPMPHLHTPYRASASAKVAKGEGVGEGRPWNGYTVYQDGVVKNSKGKAVGYNLKGVKVLDYKNANGKKSRKAIKDIVIEVFGGGLHDDEYGN